MTEQKTLTFMEAIAEARKGAYIGVYGQVTPMFWDNYHNALIWKDGGGAAVNAFYLDGKYYIVTPAPKPKVKVALYAYRVIDGWKLSDAYYIDDADFMKNSTLSTKDFMRIDWSEMEVDG